MIDEKADFTTIYTSPDPRSYVRNLGEKLDYKVPDAAAPVVRATLAAAEQAECRDDVLDMCCSYGFNAAALKHNVGIDDLIERYADPEIAGLPADRLIVSDRDFYAKQPGEMRNVIGLDASQSAIAYGEVTGLLDQGWAQDLESNDPTPALKASVQDVGLVLCTGGVGYIVPSTFDRVLSCMEDLDQVWVLSLVLRTVPYDQVATTLAEHGMVTEQVPDFCFAQRRFADDDEHRAALEALRGMGKDPSGLESEGWYYAEGYLSRPIAQADEAPIQEILTLTA